jgi:hypothetical protein
MQLYILLFFFVLQIPIKDILNFYFVFGYGVRGEIKSSLINAHYLHAKQHCMIFKDRKARQD